MKSTTVTALLMGLALAACEQESQPLGIDPTAGAVERTLSAAGGRISLASGAALHFPAGALAGQAQVSLEAAPEAGAGVAGALASSVYRAGPAELPLQLPVLAELSFDAAAPSAWLASVVVAGPAGVEEHGGTRLDLTTGIARADVEQLGTLAVVVPEAAAVFAVRPLGSAAPAGQATPIATRVGLDSLHISCGAPGRRCGGIDIEASANLLSRARSVAVLYPSIQGGLKLDPLTSTVRGTIAVDAIIRVLLQSGAIATSLPLEIERFEINQRVSLPAPFGSLSASLGAAAGAAPTAFTIRVTDTVQIINASGEEETATIAISFPVQIS